MMRSSRTMTLVSQQCLMTFKKRRDPMKKETMLRIPVRALIAKTTAELWDTLTGEFIIVFDNGELQVDARHTLYSSYCWEFHRRYPGAPVLMEHHVQHLLGDGRVSAKTQLRLTGAVLWTVHDHMVPGMPEAQAIKFRFELAEVAYRISNTMYNDMSYRLEDYVVSLDILDFLEVHDHPNIRQAYELSTNDRTSIDRIYDSITATLGKTKEMRHNPLSQLFRSNLVNKNQVMQCLGPRGYVTDTDSVSFPEPIMVGYFEGFRKFSDSLMESRSAAKSLAFSKSPLQDAEFFSRRLQMMCMAVKNLHHVDCGSTEYLHWYVRPATFDNKGNVQYAGDLKQLVGKIYHDDASGKLTAVKAGDKHLIGKNIRLRSVLHCMHPDPAGVCSVCYGELSLSVPENTNLGHMNSASMTQKSSQNVLSVKHLDGTAVVEAIVLDEGDKKFLKVSSDGNTYLLNDALKGSKVSVLVRADWAAGITDVHEVRNINDLNITRVSEMDQIGLIVDNGKTIASPVINVAVSNRRRASLTYAMLKHLRKKNWTVDELGNYVIDMDGWDYNEPFLSLPLKHVNMSDHSRDIASMLESSVREMIKRDRVATPAAVLVELFNLVNERLSVNLAVLEIVLYGEMIVSAAKMDYSLPKPWTRSAMGVMKLTIRYRSIAPHMAFQEHQKVFVDPQSYTLTNRPDHVMDGVLCPREVFAYDYNRDIPDDYVIEAPPATTILDEVVIPDPTLSLV
jgi:hypothetical protein